MARLSGLTERTESVDQNLMRELVDEAESIPGTAPPDRLGRLQALAGEVLDLDAAISDLEEDLKRARSLRHDILSRRMVDLMDDPASPIDHVGVRGTEFTCADFFHASIKEENRDAAHDWLEANEAGALIKYQVVVSFSKDSQEQAAALALYARQRYQDADVDTVRGVPWKRLTSWLREYYEGRGSLGWKAPPLDVLGATVGRVVKLGKAKKR